MAEQDHHMDWPRDSISTFDSDLSRASIAASSIFSHQSRASTCTNHSVYSLGHPQTSHSTLPCFAPKGEQQQRSFQQQAANPASRTLAEKQASNQYACSHCPNTFRKKADRKKHFQERCKKLGDGKICPSCTHIGRNAFQVKNHRSKRCHPEPVESVSLSQKRAFTCSNDGRIYYSAELFLRHFETAECALNQYQGSHCHQDRVITLLQEGRSPILVHDNAINMYAILRQCCEANGIDEEGWKMLVRSLPDDTALTFADKLEWGRRIDDGSALSRLGYTSRKEIVGTIFGAAVQHYQAMTFANQPHPPSKNKPLPEKPLPFVPSIPLGMTKLPEPDILKQESCESSNSKTENLLGHSFTGPQPSTTPVARLANATSSLPLRSHRQPQIDSPAVQETRRLLGTQQSEIDAHHHSKRVMKRAKRPPSLASEPHPDVIARYSTHKGSSQIYEQREPGIENVQATQPGSSGSGRSYSEFFNYSGYCEASSFDILSEGHLQKDPEANISQADVLTALPHIQAKTIPEPNTPKTPNRAKAFLQHIFSPSNMNTTTSNDSIQPVDNSTVPTYEASQSIRLRRQGGEWSQKYARSGNLFQDLI